MPTRGYFMVLYCYLQELKLTVCTAKEGMQSLQMKHMEELANLGKLTEFTLVSSAFTKFSDLSC